MSQLTQARLRDFLAYDPMTGVFTWRVRRANKKAGDVAGCQNRIGYWVIRVDDKLYTAHRLAWLYMTGGWPGREVDHIDRDRSNNRWKNLRAASRQQNAANRPRQANNSSGFKGVCFQRGANKYRARIQAYGKKQSLGLFDTAEDAHAAYQLAAKRLLGEFAKT